MQATQGGAYVAFDALGSAQTALPAILSLRKGGRHLQIGLASRGQGDMGMLSLPVDAMVFQEITFLGSFGCPTTGYPGLLALVAGGKLEPTRLVSSTVSVEQAPRSSRCGGTRAGERRPGRGSPRRRSRTPPAP